jgi:RNA polymerase sigma factor (sigma-70 family)
MTHTEATYTTMLNETKPTDFLQQAKTRIAAMKQAAEELRKELDLPPEAHYEVLSIMYRSPRLSGERDTEEKATNIPTPANTSIPLPVNTSVDNSKSALEAFLEHYDSLIMTLARKMIARTTLHPELHQLEIDDLAQTVRIKLWKTLQARQIMSPKPYIYAMIRSEYIRSIKCRQVTTLLPLDEEGELYQGQIIAPSTKDMQDPADELEQEESAAHLITNTVRAVMALPPRQQRAMLCALTDRVDDLILLTETFRQYHVDIETVRWPQEKAERHILNASLSIARRKLLEKVLEHSSPPTASQSR